MFVKCTSHSPGHPGPPHVMASLKAERFRPKYSDPSGQVTSRYLSQNSPSLVTAPQSIINFFIRLPYVGVLAVMSIVIGRVAKDRCWPLAVCRQRNSRSASVCHWESVNCNKLFNQFLCRCRFREISFLLSYANYVQKVEFPGLKDS